MKKCAAFFFLLVLLLAQSPLQEMLKLPVLFAHFNEHKLQEKETTFLAYMHEHYFVAEHDDFDTDRDRQLPFCADDMVIMGSQVVVPDPILPDFTPPVYQERIYPRCSSAPLLSHHSYDIWQPPKAC